MLLLPPPQAVDSRSLYYISVHMNLFKPQSYITVIRRGASERGPYVGEFECVTAIAVTFFRTRLTRIRTLFLDMGRTIE